MKIKKHARKAALTALICMALSGSALAFPTGMDVVSGSVTFYDAKFDKINSFEDIGNQGAISANSNTIINWDSFSLASGDILFFETVKGAILNRVIGNSPSEIYGALEQSGSNPMFFVNQNGITVGEGGYLNGDNIVLSTLAISDEAFNSYLDSGILNVGTDNAAAIKISGNAGIDTMLMLLGGSIDVDENVSIQIGEDGRSSNANFIAVAADGATLDLTKTYSTASIVTDTQTSAANTVNFHGTVKLGSEMGGHMMEVDSTNLSVGLTGGAVNLDGAKVTTMSSHFSEMPSGDVMTVIDVQAGSLENSTLTATTENTISAKGLTVTGTDNSLDGVAIVGGSVSLEDSNINTDNLALYAGNSYSLLKYSGEYGEAYGELLTATTANSVSLKNSTVSTKYTTCIAGGDLALTDGTNVTAETLLAYATDKMKDTADGVMTGATYTVTIDSSSSITADKQETAGKTWTESTGAGVPSSLKEAARDTATIAPRRALLDRNIRAAHDDGRALDRVDTVPRVEIVAVETEPTVTIDDERK